MNADSFTVGKLTVKIEYDSDPESPREWDNLGTMVCWHRRYRLGDEQPKYSPSEFKPEEHAVCLPLYLYDHSGLRIKVGSFAGLLPQGHAEFDSGQVGWIYCDAEKIRMEYSVESIDGVTLEKVEEVLRAEVKTYDEFLSGQVYGYVIQDESGHTVDSCWGFYGLEYVRQEARERAEYWNKEREKTDRMLE